MVQSVRDPRPGQIPQTSPMHSRFRCATSLPHAWTRLNGADRPRFAISADHQSWELQLGTRCATTSPEGSVTSQGPLERPLAISPHNSREARTMEVDPS